MDTGNFDFRRRVLMCGSCGAPLETGFAGGTVKCGYCGSTSQFLPRREEPVEPLDAAVEMDEEARMEMLRRQDGRQPEIPQELRPLLAGDALAPWKVGEALSLWNSTCRDLARSSDYSGSELLYYLTIILSNHFSAGKDALRERALYESALEVMTLPRHRQIMRGFLARKAALEGDPVAARRWLDPCDPRSQDLETDSSYRVSMADVLTVEEDWEGVLGILGPDIEAVPVTASLDGKAIVQRANALERLGRTGEAVRQLQLFMEVNGAPGRNALRSIRGVYSSAGLEVCPEAMNAAEEAFDLSRGRAAAGLRNPGCFGQTFAIAGLLLLALGFLLGPVLGPEAGGIPLGARIMLFLMGAVFLLIGLFSMRAARRAMRLVTGGIEGTGTVLSMEPSAWTVNEVQQYLLELEIQLPGREPYTASAKLLVPDEEKQRYSRGAIVPVRVDPKDPRQISVMD